MIRQQAPFKSFCTQGQSFWPFVASSPHWGCRPDFVTSLSCVSDLCSHSHLGASPLTRGWVILPSRILVVKCVCVCFGRAKNYNTVYTTTNIQNLSANTAVQSTSRNKNALWRKNFDLLNAQVGDQYSNRWAS
jgi:hypothetical protein